MAAEEENSLSLRLKLSLEELEEDVGDEEESTLLEEGGTDDLEDVFGISDEEENESEVAGDKVEVEDDEEDEVEDVDELDVGGRKRKLRAAIWLTAAKKVDDKAMCLVCSKYYTCTRSNTSVIRSHVKNVHPGSDECKKFLALEKKMIDDAARKNNPKPKITMLDFISSKKALTKSESQKMTDSVEDYLIQTNRSMNTVENPAFRKMLFSFHSGYVAPSRTTITVNIDKKIKEKKEALKREIKEDIKDTITASVTTDGGPSQDKNKTKKNTVTLSRINNEWKMKTDTLALVVAEGSQTASVIRTVVKEVTDDFGNEEWDINMTTDDAAAPRSARNPNRHHEVGLNVKYDVMCLDHQIHLLVGTSFIILFLTCTACIWSYFFLFRSRRSSGHWRSCWKPWVL